MQILDELRIQTWQNSSSGQKGINFPQSIYRALCPQVQTEKMDNTPKQYEESGDFDKEWKRLTRNKA